MKNIFYFFAAISLLTIPGLLAQPIPAERTEVVYSDAYSFYNGKGAGALHFLDSLYGISYVPGSSFYSITTDGGATWRDGRPNELIPAIRKMYITGRDTLVAVRDSNIVLHSYNSGETWNVTTTLWSGEYLANFLFFNSRYAVNIKTDGQFMISSDRGENWLSASWQYRKVKPSLFYNNGYLFAIEVQQTPNPAKILYSTNNGYVWNSLVLPSSITDYIWIARGSTGFILGTNYGVVYLVSEQGAILKRLESPGVAQAGGYFYRNDSEIWGIDTDANSGIKGLSIYSVSESATSYIPIPHALRYADNIAATTFDKVVVGSGHPSSPSGLFIRHRYGFRDVLVERYEIPGSGDASSLFFVNEAKGFVGGSTGWIEKTTDGGKSWTVTTVPATIPVIKGFAKRSDTEFIAFCEGGTILESSDDGMTWVNAGSRFTGNIKKAVFAGRDTIFFCTADSLYITTPSWQVITPVVTGLTGGNYRDLDFYGLNNGSATYIPSAGGTSMALVTTDRGANWQTKSFDGWMLTFDPEKEGLFFKYSTQMGTWYDGSGGRFTDVSTHPVYFDQASNGNIALTSGAKSVYFSFGERATYRHIFLENNTERKGIVAAGGNTFYLLSSGGRFWKFSNSTNAQVPTTVLRSHPADGASYIYHNLTFKWQEPWTVAPVTEYNLQLALGDTSNMVEDISGIDSTFTTVNLTADTALYFWRVRAANRNGWGSFNPWHRFSSSVFADEAKAWQTAITHGISAAVILPDGSVVVGDTLGNVSRTDNPPGDWTFYSANTTYPLYKFWLDPNNNFIFAYSWGNTYFMSKNRGLTWYRIDMPFGGSTMFHAINSAPPNLYFGAGSDGTIYKGLMASWFINWTNLFFSPYTGANLAIDTWGETGIAAVGEKGSVTISTNGGATFRHISLDLTETYHEVGFAPDGTLVILNQKGERRVSTDMGNTWTFESFGTIAPLRDMITMDGVSVLVDKLGGIYTAVTPTAVWKYVKLPYGDLPLAVNISADRILLPAENGKLFNMPVNHGSSTGVKDATPVAGFTLTQNYPNPFNPETVIRFALPVAGFAKGVVYDILGREVATLVNGEMPAGEHRVSFNAVNLPSGVYIFRLESGKHSSAIKMLLSK